MLEWEICSSNTDLLLTERIKLMGSIIEIIISLVGGLVIGLFAMWAIKRKQEGDKKNSARVEAERIVNRAKSEASRIEKEAQSKAQDFEQRARRNVESDIQNQKQQVKHLEQDYQDKISRLKNKETELTDKFEKQMESIKDREHKTTVLENRLSDMEKKMQEQLQVLAGKLESVANMSAAEARRELMKAMEEEARQEASKQIAVIEEETKAEAEKKSKKILSQAISRFAGEYSVERCVSVVELPSDEMKGKIIGREGRNIRTLESLCGVDLIVDDTPEAVVISGFDPVRREVARLALVRLMEDGRVHPARIEEMVDKVKDELFKTIRDDGEKACLDLGLTGIHPEIIKLIGSLKYRTSFTQNNYTHSIEVGFMCGIMAGELGINVKKARRAGLLHDVGKALDHSVEGSHAVIGANFLKKHGEADDICHAVRAHHEDEKPETILAHLVIASDALSSARPGARRSMMNSYIQRLEDLESIGNSFDGVIRTFAIQAGREIRVMVEGGRVTDDQAVMLSRDIARKIEREMAYPGQIKVTVIRETRAVEHAR